MTSNAAAVAKSAKDAARAAATKLAVQQLKVDDAFAAKARIADKLKSADMNDSVLAAALAAAITEHASLADELRELASACTNETDAAAAAVADPPIPHNETADFVVVSLDRGDREGCPPLPPLSPKAVTSRCLFQSGQSR